LVLLPLLFLDQLRQFRQRHGPSVDVEVLQIVLVLRGW
jgi:hypothetical protein